MRKIAALFIAFLCGYGLAGENVPTGEYFLTWAALMFITGWGMRGLAGKLRRGTLRLMGGWRLVKVTDDLPNEPQPLRVVESKSNEPKQPKPPKAISSCDVCKGDDVTLAGQKIPCPKCKAPTKKKA
jgi:hypothetical protein